MYFEHFGLSRPPFEDTTNPAFFFASANAQAVLAELGAALDGEGGLLLVEGAAGVGKSLLAQVFAKDAGANARVVMLAVPPAARDGWTRLASGLGVQAPCTASMDRKVAQLLEAIDEQDAPRTVVLVDRAENLAAEDLIALQRLAQAAAKKSLHLHVVLFATPHLDSTLRQPDAKRAARSLRRLTGLLAIPADEMPGYLAARLAAADGPEQSPFEGAAISRLAEVSAGLPREVNALAKRAMMRAATREAAQITAEDIDAAVEEAAEAPAVVEEPAGPPVSPEHAGPEGMPAGADPVRAAVLVSRLEHAMAAAPQQLRTLEIGISRLREEANRLLTEAQGRLERAAEMKVEVGEEAAALIKRHSDIEAAIEKAEAQQQQLAEFARRMAQVGQTAEERLGLLMTSLDTANGIHDKLQRVGEDVVGLAEEAHGAAAGERARLQQLVDEIHESHGRLAEMLEESRRQRDAALDEHRQALNRQLGEVQSASAETTTNVHAVLEQMRREMAEMQAAQLQQASAHRAEIQKLAAAQRTELQALAAAAREEARAELAAMQQEFADARQGQSRLWEKAQQEQSRHLEQLRTTMSTVRSSTAQTVRATRRSLAGALRRQRALVAETRRMVATECAAIQSATGEVQNHHRQALDEARAVQESIRHDVGALQAQAKEHATLLTAMTDAQRRTHGMLGRAEDTARSLEKMLADSQQTSAALAEQAVQAQQLREAGVAALATAATRGEGRVTEALRRLEGIVQTEQAARDAARETLVAARSALAQVNDAQQKLGEAQQAAIDVEAAAASTRASVQTEIKRAEENLRTVVSTSIDKAQAVINGMVDDAARTARQTLGAVETAAGGAARRIRDELNSAMDEARLEHEAARVRSMEAASELVSAATAQYDRLAAAQGSAESAQQQLDEAAEAAQRAALEMVEQVRQQAMRVAEKAGSAVEATAERTQRALGETTGATLARLAGEVEEMTSSAHERLGKTVDEAVEAGLADLSTRMTQQVDAALGTVRATSAEAIAASSREIQETAALGVQRVAEATSQSGRHIEETSAATEKRIQEVAQAAAQAITEQLGSANDAARALKEAIRTAQTTIREVATCREQVDHAIRDVWSLTSTTDERARQLGALAESAATTESNLTTLLSLCEERSADLKVQAASAEGHVGALAEQHQRVSALLENLTRQTTSAGGMHEDLQEAVGDGQQLADVLRREAERLAEGLATARDMLTAIQSEDEKVQQMTAQLADLTGAAGALDLRVTELQQGVAQPLAIIQNARTQAEELNDICLAVKRVFRSVTQASAEAGERMNLLGQLLAATERAAHTMKQWVEEANHARDRLETTLTRVPSIQQTHPSLMVPKLPTDGAASAGGGKPLIDPADTELLKRLLGQVAPASPAAAKPAGPAGHAAETPPAPDAEEADVADAAVAEVTAVPSASAAKQIEPLAEALKSRQAVAPAASAREPALAATAPKAAPRSAAPEGGSAARVLKGSSPAGNGNRLRPEDVRAMIEEARKRAASK